PVERLGPLRIEDRSVRQMRDNFDVARLGELDAEVALEGAALHASHPSASTISSLCSAWWEASWSCHDGASSLPSVGSTRDVTHWWASSASRPCPVAERPPMCAPDAPHDASAAASCASTSSDAHSTRIDQCNSVPA